MAKKPSKKQQEVFASALGKAFASAGKGDQAWLYRAALNAGFMPGGFERLRGKDVSELWGVSGMAVSKWFSRDGCPRNRDKTYDLSKVIAWREEGLQEDLLEAEGDTDSETMELLRQAKLRIANVDADIKEMSVVSLDEMKMVLSHFVFMLRNLQDALKFTGHLDASETVGKTIQDFASEVKKTWEKLQR